MGQLEGQNKRNALLAIFDVLPHLVKMRTAFNQFTRFSLILIFVSNLIIIKFCKGLHVGFMGIQRVAINLHGSGKPHIGINFYLFFFHGPFSLISCLLYHVTFGISTFLSVLWFMVLSSWNTRSDKESKSNSPAYFSIIFSSKTAKPFYSAIIGIYPPSVRFVHVLRQHFFWDTIQHSDGVSIVPLQLGIGQLLQKTFIQIIFQCLRYVLHFPTFQKMQIIAQHP